MNAEITTITESIWSAVLGFDLETKPVADNSVLSEPILTGVVHITGKWNGSICLHCPVTVARTFAARIFECSPESITDDELGDVVGELTNMISGNLKPILPGPSLLSLPMVQTNVTISDKNGFASRDQLICLASFACAGHPFQVSVVEMQS